MIRKLIRITCLMLALLMIVPAHAATLISSTENVQVQNEVKPISTSAQANASAVTRMLDNDPSTRYNYTAWSSTGSDDIPELTFSFNGVSLSEIWIRIGDQSSYTNYFGYARPSTIRVRVRTAWTSYDYVYAMDDYYDTTTVGNGWMRGYQALALPSVLNNVMAVELFITGWNIGTIEKYNVCLSDILFAGSPTAAIEPPTSPIDELNNMAQTIINETNGSAAVPATLTQRMATRSGPSTVYDELGSYFKAGQEVDVLTRAWDEHNGMWWVQVEFTYSGKLRRAYTGIQRVNVDLGLLEEEAAISTALLNCPVLPFFGPGQGYAQHRDMISAGTPGTVYAFENGYAQFEYLDKSAMKTRRVWVPMDALSF